MKKLTLELYLWPKREPDVSSLDLPLGKLARRWAFRGVFGRDTRKAAGKALDAAERLDLERVLAQRPVWHARDVRPASLSVLRRAVVGL